VVFSWCWPKFILCINTNKDLPLPDSYSVLYNIVMFFKERGMVMQHSANINNELNTIGGSIIKSAKGEILLADLLLIYFL
jgi:hypothetical protein